jgi:hypothetical protein
MKMCVQNSGARDITSLQMVQTDAKGYGEKGWYEFVAYTSLNTIKSNSVGKWEIDAGVLVQVAGCMGS